MLNFYMNLQFKQSFSTSNMLMRCKFQQSSLVHAYIIVYIYAKKNEWKLKN